MFHTKSKINIKQLLTSTAIKLLIGQIEGEFYSKVMTALNLDESFHTLSTTDFPYLANIFSNYCFLNIELVKTVIAIKRLIQAIWPNMKGTAEFSLLFKKNKNKHGKYIYIFLARLSYHFTLNYVYMLTSRLYSLCFPSSLCYRIEII